MVSNALSEVVVFRVVGELRGDPNHLLLESPDGRRYDYDIARGTVTPVEPCDAWEIDVSGSSEVHIWSPAPMIVA